MALRASSLMIHTSPSFSCTWSQLTDAGARERLVHDVPAPARVGDHLAVADRVAVEEDALSRDLDVVEDDEGVLLVKARGERVVEGVPRLGEAGGAGVRQA